MNANGVPVPERLRKFPLWRGYLVHHTVFIGDDGTPDFKVVDQRKQAEAYQRNLCHLCGEGLGSPVAFIGGPLCEKNRIFMDGPMHPECADYAAKVCPYLCNANGRHSGAEPRHAKDGSVKYSHVPEVATGRPARMAVFTTAGYQVRLMGSVVVSLADPWIAVDYSRMPERMESDQADTKK